MAITWSTILNYADLAKQRFADFILVLLNSRQHKIYLAANLLANLFVWAASAVVYRLAAQGTLILHYNVDFGVDYLGEGYNVFLLPVSATVVLALNFYLVYAVSRYRPDKIISNLLFAGALAVNLLILVSEYFLYLINYQ